MNPELPKSIRSALAQKAAVTTHPSADVLTAFAEHTLSGGENERVANHLAGCSECREVLYLASAAEESYAAESQPELKVTSTPRPRWTPRLAWLVSGVAGIAIVGGLLRQQYLDRSGSKVEQVAQVHTQPPPSEFRAAPPELTATAPRAEKPPHAATAKTPEPDRASGEKADVAAKKSAPPSVPESPVATDIAQSTPANQPPTTVIGGSGDSINLVAPTQNAFAEAQSGSSRQSFAALQSASPPLGLMRKVPATKTWRVTPEGQLEHFSATGWTSTLTDQPAKFRCVAESPNGVWAGGSQGELFHSKDGGGHWNQIALPVPPDGKDDAIVSIHFADPRHGFVVTENGARYISSDGGTNWQKE
jgi:hypothetical protein